MAYENDYASNGKGNLGVTLGGVALGTSLLGGNLANLLGGGCSQNAPVSRYEAELNAKNAALESEVKFRDSNIYTDQKLLDLYKYVDGKFAGVESKLCQQDVVNAQITANISCMQSVINTLQSLTKTIIPIDGICPAPMPQFNSWAAPSTTA